MKRDIVSAYVHIRRDTPLPLSTPVHILNETPSIPRVALVMNGIFLNQKTNKNIRMSHSLKYKHSKKNLYEKIKVVQDEISIQGSSYVSYAFYGRCIVARIVSFDTARRRLVTFRISEPCPSTDILTPMTLLQYALMVI